jgi:cytochrome c553
MRFGAASGVALGLALGATNAGAAGDAAVGETKAQVCVQCHGPGGNSMNSEFPSLAAQPPLYVQYQLIQFREQRRKDPRMSPFAEKLTDADMKDLGAYFSQQKLAPAAVAPDAAKAEAGKAVAQSMHCNSCHRPDFSGQQHIARLAGQHEPYLVKELRGFKTGARPDIDGSMASAAQPLTDADIVNVAHYLATYR